MPRRALARLREVMGLPKRTRGAQPGNQNRLKHGLYTRAFLRRRARTGVILRRSRELVARLDIFSREIRASSQRKAHRAAISKPAPFFGQQRLAQPRIELAVAQFDESVTGVEGRVPCDVSKGRQRDGAQAAGARGVDGEVEQRPAKAAALKFLRDGQLDDMQNVARDLAAQFADYAGLSVFGDPNRARGDRGQKIFSASDRFVRHPGEFRNAAKERASGLFECGQQVRFVLTGQPNGKGRRT